MKGIVYFNIKRGCEMEQVVVGRYKVVDKDAYFASAEENRDIYERFFINDEVEITHTHFGRGMVIEEGKNATIILQSELPFFEYLGTEKPSPAEKPDPDNAIKVWDGNPETLEIGTEVMHIITSRKGYVTYIFTSCDACVVMFGEEGDEACRFEFLSPVEVDPKKVFQANFLELWKRQSLDNAHDGLHNLGSIKEVLDIIWDLYGDEIGGARVR